MPVHYRHHKIIPEMFTQLLGILNETNQPMTTVQVYERYKALYPNETKKLEEHYAANTYGQSAFSDIASSLGTMKQVNMIDTAGMVYANASLKTKDGLYPKSAKMARWLPKPGAVATAHETKPFTTRLELTDIAALEKRAAEKGISPSTLAARAVKAYLSV